MKSYKQTTQQKSLKQALDRSMMSYTRVDPVARCCEIEAKIDVNVTESCLIPIQIWSKTMPTNNSKVVLKPYQKQRLTKL